MSAALELDRGYTDRLELDDELTERRERREAARSLLGFLGPESVVYEHTPTKEKKYFCHNRRPTEDDLRKHLGAYRTIAVSKAARMFSIDVDGALPKGTIATEEEKRATLDALLQAVPSLREAPAMIVDSARGVHVHLFLTVEPPPDQVTEVAGERLKVETFGRAGSDQAVRLPFGWYAGKHRNVFPVPLPTEAVYDALIAPPLTTPGQLEAIIGEIKALAPAPKPSRAVTVDRPDPPRGKPRLWTAEPRAIVLPAADGGPLDTVPSSPPDGIRQEVWARMRRAARGLVTHGCQIVGLSNKADLALFNEIGLAGETDPETLIAAILNVEHPVSSVTRSERERAVRYIVEHYTPRPFGCCQLHPLAEGETDRSVLRRTIREWCTAECARTCHIYNRQAAADVTEGYARASRSPIWFDSRGDAARFTGTGTFGKTGYGVWQYTVRSHQDVPGSSVLADPILFARRLGIHPKTSRNLLNRMLAAGVLAYTDRSRKELRAPELAESRWRQLERLTGGQARARARKIRAEADRKRLDALWNKRMRVIFGRGG